MSSLDHLKQLQVLIAVPSNGLWQDKFGVSLVSLMSHFLTHKLGNYKSQSARLASIAGSILSNQRMDAMLGAASAKSISHLLFVDSDQTFPMDMLQRLVLRDEDVVAANIATKKIPAQPTAMNRDGEGWKPVYTTEESTGLEKVDRIGCGVMLIKRKVFQAIVEDDNASEAFCVKWVPKVRKYQGEDWALCELIEKLGFNIFIDHDLSQEIGHVGNFVYTHEVVGTIELQPREEANGETVS